MKRLTPSTLFSSPIALFTGLPSTLWAVLFLFFSLSPSGLICQSTPHPSFRQFTTDEGLASSEVYCILQDQEGFIWISSDNGVSRFDGYAFRHYGLQDGLQENVIFLLRLDTLGRVWMQAQSGNLYYYDKSGIHPYWNNAVLQEYNDKLDVNKGFIVEGAGQTIHVANLKYGFLSIHQDGRVVTYPHEELVYRQVFEKDGQLINAAAENGDEPAVETYMSPLNRQKRSSPYYFHYQDEVWAFPELDYASPQPKMPEAFWLGAGKYLLQVCDKVWLIEQGEIKWEVTFSPPILYARLWGNGQLYLGLGQQHGLGVYSSLDAFRLQKGMNRLEGRTVSYVMEDRAGGRWFATNEDGIFYTPAEDLIVYDEAAGLPYQKVTALAVKSEEKLYVGLGNGAIWQLNPLEENWEALPDVPNAGMVKDLYLDRSRQQLWAGNANLYSWQNEQWTPMPLTLKGDVFFPSQRITINPAQDRLWLSDHRGFMSMDLPGETPANQCLGRGERTYITREDFDGRVWVGQSTGLFEWKNGVLSDLHHLHPAFSLRIEDIALMPDSTLVIATKGGGLVFWKGQQFEQLTTEQGLTANMLECVYADADNGIWAGTLNGLNHITGPWGERRIRPITSFHGLPSNEINRVEVFDSIVWVATNKGLVRLSSQRMSQDAPQPTLTAVFANNQSTDLTSSIQLSHVQNTITIQFLAINYKMNGKIPYRYRMDGGDWAQTFNRSLNFLMLPPGERHFELQAQNEDGVWSDSTSLHLIIYPPWWAHWWVRGLGLILMVGLILAAYRYRIRQLKKSNQIQLQITALERSALQAQMNPHFIFNCLNSIQNYILQNKKEAAILYLGSFAELVRSMLNASVAGSISLHEEMALLDNYLALEKLRFKERFTYEIATAKGLDIFETMIPPLLVQPYVENALQHGISGRKGGGQVSIHFEEKKAYLEVTIKDNGTGWNPTGNKLNSLPFYKSFGMSITHHRLKLLSDNAAVPLVDVQRLVDETGEPCGTVVLIRISPAEKKAGQE